MSKWFVAAIVVLAGACAACVAPSIGESQLDDAVTQVSRLSDFSKIDASDAFQVDIKQSDGYSLVIEVDRDLVDDLIVEKHQDTLVLGLRPHRSTNRYVKTLRAEISMPELVELELSGASSADFLDMKVRSPMRITTSGASEIEGDLEAERVQFNVSGASDLRLNGRAQSMILDASGASEIDLLSFPVETADVGVSGSSKANISVNGTLSASASGSSSLRYRGNPSIDRKNTSGGSSIKRM